MAHDVFISYAVEDGPVAEKVCRALEESSIKCWMAPRDVPVGTDYEEAIVDAISASPLLVLILSAHSNASPHVKREIQNACAEGSTTQIIPFRIDAVAYSKALRYYLGSAQWLDASTPPLEAHLRRLVEHARAHLRRTDEPTRPAPTPVIPLPVPPRPVAPVVDDATPPATVNEEKRKPLPAAWLAVGAGALVLVAVIALTAYLLGGDGSQGNGNSGGGNSNNVANDNGGVALLVTPTPAANVNAPTPALNANSQRPTPTPRRTPEPTRTPTPPSTPTPTPTPSPVDMDRYIARMLKRKMSGYAGLKAVRYEVKNGTVLLTGEVASKDCLQLIEILSRQIKGVVHVVNKIDIVSAPVTQGCDPLIG